MDNELYAYSPIRDRNPIGFPGDTTLAFYIGLNIEHYHIDARGQGADNIPDPLIFGKRDYGTRVGIWRIFELFAEVGMRASAITNSEVCTRYPQIIEAGIACDWAWVAHGKTNSIRQANMTVEEEQKFLSEMVSVLDDSLPSRPKGWLGPGLSETFNTPRLLHDLGFTYLLDWCCDDQPFALSVPGMISVPYSLEVNDIVMVKNQTLTGPDYERIVLDQFEVLLADSSRNGRVMALPLHPYVTGQPHLFKYLERVLREICATKEVWKCTSDDIALQYLATIGNPSGA
jgi:peptidoglycan/xylan/chitin deacetylase (PgdA/CDA1 family)